MFSNSACLGLSVLGICSYNPASPEIYFSIGEGISALAILFLLKQFVGPIERFRLSIKYLSEGITTYLFFLAVGLVFIAALLPLIPGQAFPLIGYPIFWEVLAGLLFVFAIFLFYRSMSKPVKFSKNNCKKYAQQCHQMMAKNNENELGLLAAEIKWSIRAIFDSIKNRNKSNYCAEQAAAIVFMLSEKKLCKIIVNNSFYTLREIFDQIKNHSGDAYLKCNRSLIKELIKQSITNADSILSRERDSTGVGTFKSYALIFSDYSFIVSDFRPLDSWSFYGEEIKPWQIENYFFILTTALEGCIKNNTFIPVPNPFITPFEKIARLTMSAAYNLKRLPENEAEESLPYQLLSKISAGFMDIIEILNKNTTPIIKFNPDKYDYLDDPSIYGIITYGIFQFIEGLSVCLAHDQLTDAIVRALWVTIYNEDNNVEIRNRISYHLLNKVKDNLENHFYPLVTRLIIKLDGLSEPEPDSPYVLINTLRGLLKKNYKSICTSKPEFAKDILPENVYYDKDKNMLIQTWPREKITTLTLE